MPPFSRARSAIGTSDPTGAKIIAASNFSGGISSEPPAQTAPNERANFCPALSPGRVNAKTSRFSKQRNLGDQMRRGAETIDAKFAAHLLFSGTIGNRACQRKEAARRDVFILFGQRKTKSRIGDSEFRIAAIDRVAGEARVIAKIFAARFAKLAFSARPTEPRNADAIANLETA